MCSTDKNIGTRNRTRECMDGIDITADDLCIVGNSTEIADCNTEPCERCLQPMLDEMCLSNEFKVPPLQLKCM